MPDWSGEIRARLAALSLSPEREALIVEELSAHLDDAFQEQISAGMSAEQARAAALGQLSDGDALAGALRNVERPVTPVAPLGAPSRGTQFAENLSQDVRYAFRQIRSAPWLTLIMIAVLALGIGASSAAVSYLRGIATIPAPGVRADNRLVQVAVAEKRKRGMNRARAHRIPFATFVALRNSVREFRGFAGESPDRMSVDFGSGARSTQVAAVTSDYFEVLGLHAEIGSLLRERDSVNAIANASVVISERVWSAQFGRTSDVIGRTLRINDVPFTIVGVAPQDFAGLRADFHAPSVGVWMPIGTLRAILPPSTSEYSAAERDSLFITNMVARLADGATVDDARAQLGSAGLSLLRSGDSLTTLSTWSEPLRMGNGPGGRDGDIVLSEISIGIFAIVILIIACTNVSALLLGRAASRRHEVSVRFSLGADRARIVRQLLTESVVLASLAAVAGLIAIFAIRRAVSSYTLDDGLLLFPLDWVTLLTAIGAAIVTGIIFGLSPAMHATHSSIFSSINQGAAPSDWRRTRAQRAMIVVQLALSQPLVLVTAIALGLIAAQQPWKSTFDDADRVVGIGLDVASRRYTQAQVASLISTIRTRLAGLPEVERTEVVERIDGIFEAASTGTSMIEFVPERTHGPTWERNWRGSNAELMHVGSGFFQTSGIPIVRGRAFVASDTLSQPGVPRSVILPEEVAQLYWPNENPIGKRLGTPNEATPDGGRFLRPGAPVSYDYVVVGTARSPRTVLPDERPRVYWPGWDNGQYGTTIIARTRISGDATLGRIRAEIQRVDPQVPIVELTTAARAVRANASSANRLGVAATSLAMFALVLASLGLAGIVMFAVSQRTREIGVRVALGATQSDVIGLFVRQGVRTALLGFAIGIPISALLFFGALKFFFAPHVALNVSAAVVAAAVLLGVVLVASWIPARRAARVDPLVALRAE